MDNIPYHLISKILQNEATNIEAEKVEKWAKNGENMNEYKKLQKIMDHSFPKEYEPDVDSALNTISQRLPQQKAKKGITRGVLLRIAGVMVLGLFIVSVFLLNRSNGSFKVIAEKGNGIVKHQLPDGSIVTLNEGAEFTYNRSFGKENRTLNFNGEAYFEVAKNKELPFVILSERAETKVLGTKFNLNTAVDSIILLVVTEGLVSFNSTKGGEKQAEVLIEAGQMGLINKGSGKISRKTSDNENVLSWKTGVLNYSDYPFGKALEEIARFYKVSIKLETKGLSEQKFQGYFEKDSLSKALSTLELLMDVSIQFKNGVYVIAEKS